MERRELGRTGLQVSVLGFGGSEIGFERAEPGMVRQLLQEALDAGLNVIDTAECYGDSEALVGQAVADRRSEYYLFTKCGHFEGTGRDDWSPASLEKSITRSLARLRTDHVDLLQLHTCTEDDLRRGDVIEVIERARQRGQTRFIGYSGDGPAARYAVECGRFDTLQTSINVADQEALHLTLPLAQARGVGVIAKRPIANAAWRTGERPSQRLSPRLLGSAEAARLRVPAPAPRRIHRDRAALHRVTAGRRHARRRNDATGSLAR